MEEAKETTNSMMMLNSSDNRNNPLDNNDWLLEEISKSVYGVCTNRGCIEQAEKTFHGVEHRVILRGDFVNSGCAGNADTQHHKNNERRVVCMFCSCNYCF
jgi:hypothetical protein